MRRGLLAILILLCVLPAAAQRRINSAFAEACDSLSVLLTERTSVHAELKLKSVSKRGKALDFHFTGSLGEVPWRRGDIKWFRQTLQSLFPASYRGYSVGKIFCKTQPFDELVVTEAGNDGTPPYTIHRETDHRGRTIVYQENGQNFQEGLSGRHLAVWQSHGRYFEAAERRWEWQRAPTYMTVEDAYTQSYVLPFLIPMLENAGAYVMTPRERDTQWREIVCDNDLSFADEADGTLRKHGFYYEKGRWKDAGTGFADTKKVYLGSDNPFRMGTARKIDCDRKGSATATWEPSFETRGEYAVYVSYKTLNNSTAKAHYTVQHRGGATSFIVNQKMGGGTWIYLGTFEFGPDGKYGVTLSNKGESDQAVSADAVRFGGGMGKIARGCDDEPSEEWTTSGLPAYLEGAIYSMQYAGVDSTLLQRYDNDYTSDFGIRGAWVGRMAGGSRANPDSLGLGIPFDAALAFHSDAGTSPNDSIIGTLAIYSLKCEGKRRYPGGGDRIAAREYADFVQTQVCNDIRATFEPEWSRRQIWDRSYSESRTSFVPCIILETLSHQNFADMKYGLDPSFRFTVSRAVYKGMLKFLSSRYGCPYSVQPLPVNSFSVRPGQNYTAILSWKPTDDPLEETARPTGYIIYTKVDDGAWDQGAILENPVRQNGHISTSVVLQKGHIYSFQVRAFNAGGRSFPSETLSAGIPEKSSGKTVIVVNNFTRVSAPANFDTPQYAGFNTKIDGGVPYMKDISHIGQMFEFHRDQPWEDDDNPGFGASFTDEAGKQYAGNTFDYPFVHGKAFMTAGCSFYSESADAFCSDELPSDIAMIDLICGKQVTVSPGRAGASPDRFTVFTPALKKRLTKVTSEGKDLLVSGAYIATDIWSKVYRVSIDSLEREDSKRFAQNVLGYRYIRNSACRSGEVEGGLNRVFFTRGIRASFQNTPSEDIICAESPDGLAAAQKTAAQILRYTDSSIGAAVAYKAKGYKVVSFGFPLETVTDAEQRQTLFDTVLKFFYEQ